MSSQKSRTNWESVLKIAIEEAKNYYLQNKIEPTLRGLFYILISKNVIPNTRSAYNTLSKVIAEYRYQGGKIHLRDLTRPHWYLEKEEKEAVELSEEEIKKIIENYIQNASSYTINEWDDQPKRVIVVLEKEAQFDFVKQTIQEVFPFGVYKLICSRGFDSATDIIILAKEILKIKKEGKNAVVLVLSDFDPSGEEIFIDFKNRLFRLSTVPNLDIEKVAITKEQIFQFNLPYAPESEEEIKKLKRDPRYDRFVAQHGLMRVELDALVSLRPNEFKQIIKQAIEKHFDYEIYKSKTLPRIEEAKKKSEEIAKKNLEKLNKIFKS
jgi:5S rRNA maturation endonuclease (ribonuclease M5)